MKWYKLERKVPIQLKQDLMKIINSLELFFKFKRKKATERNNTQFSQHLSIYSGNSGVHTSIFFSPNVKTLEGIQYLFFTTWTLRIKLKFLLRLSIHEWYTRWVVNSFQVFIALKLLKRLSFSRDVTAL